MLLNNTHVDKNKGKKKKQIERMGVELHKRGKAFLILFDIFSFFFVSCVNVTNYEKNLFSRGNEKISVLVHCSLINALFLFINGNYQIRREGRKKWSWAY